MIKLTIGSSEVPINQEISFPLVLRSPFFPTSDGKIPGSFIFNTRLPSTKALRTEFSNAHRIMRHGRATAELSYVLENGTFRFSGTCIVVEANEQQYEIAFKVGNGDLAGILSTRSLKDLDLGGDRDVTSQYSLAHDDGYSITSYEETNLFYLTYSIIDVDIRNNFLGNATTWHSDENGNINIKLLFDLSNAAIENYQIRLYKENGTYEAYPLVYGLNEINVSFAVTNTSTFSFAIYTERKEGDPIRYTLKRIYLEYSYSNAFDECVLKDQTESDFVVFPIKNDALLNNFPDDAFELDNLSLKTIYTKYFPVLNYWAYNHFPLFMYAVSEDEFFVAANLFTPFVYIYKILNQIASEAGYRIVNNPFESEFEGAVLFNAYAENTYTGEDTRLTLVKETFNLIDHVPDITQAEFIREISKLIGYFPVVDNNQLTITFVKVNDLPIESVINPSERFYGKFVSIQSVSVQPEYNGIVFEIESDDKDQYLSSRIKEISDKLVYKGEVASINLLPTTDNIVNDMYKVTATNSFYVWQYNPDTYTLTWVFFTRDWPLKYEEGSAPFFRISTKISPILTTYILDEVLGAPTERYWTIPITKQPGILEGFPESLGSEYGLQMLMYRGKIMDSNNDLYPLGTTRTTEYANDFFPDINARELFNSQLKNFMSWIAYSAKPVKVKAILTEAQLKSIDFSKIYRYDGFSFMIKELRVNLLHDHLSLAEIDIYTC